MAQPSQVTLEVFRYDPEADQAPRYERYTVPYRPHMRVLDALNYLYDHLGVGLAYRWFCGIKKCGECGVTLNGRPVLACWAPAEPEMRCEPLANFPIIRDLAVDTSAYEGLILGLLPYTVRRRLPPYLERLPHSRMALVDRLSACLECLVCSSAVPVAQLGPEGIDWNGYTGPAAWVKFARFALDPRDEADRLPLAHKGGLDRFPLYAQLADICPQHIDILRDALLPLRRRFLGEERPPEPVREEGQLVFVRARGWSALVRLTQEGLQALLEQGRLREESLPGWGRAYRLEE